MYMVSYRMVQRVPATLQPHFHPPFPHAVAAGEVSRERRPFRVPSTSHAGLAVDRAQGIAPTT